MTIVYILAVQKRVNTHTHTHTIITLLVLVFIYKIANELRSIRTYVLVERNSGVFVRLFIFDGTCISGANIILICIIFSLVTGTIHILQCEVQYTFSNVINIEFYHTYTSTIFQSIKCYPCVKAFVENRINIVRKIHQSLWCPNSVDNKSLKILMGLNPSNYFRMKNM